MFDEQSDNELISFATEMWANYIETYCISMSAKNAVERNHKNEDFKIKYHYEPNHLASYQKRLVKRLRELSDTYKKENDG